MDEFYNYTAISNLSYSMHALKLFLDVKTKSTTNVNLCIIGIDDAELRIKFHSPDIDCHEVIDLVIEISRRVFELGFRYMKEKSEPDTLVFELIDINPCVDDDD